MMSTNKRKIFASDTSDEDDSFKHRRSSLRVNLSYCENLIDSGNGSLWRTEIETDGKGTDTVRANKRLSRRKRYDKYENKNHQFDSDNEEGLRVESDTSKLAVSKNTNVSLCVKKRMQLKELRVNLENINIKEKTLEANCKRLKDAILNKTKEIFDRENELSRKTAMILKNEENCFVDDIHDANIGNKSIILDAMSNHQLRNKAIMEHERCINSVSNQQRGNQYSNIVTTPTNSKKLESCSKGDIDKSRSSQRRLFAEEGKQIEGQAKCRIIEDIVLKEKFPLFPLRQTDQTGSPILSGSNRRLSLLKKSKLYSQSQSENHNTTYSTIHSQCVDIGAPIVCSTFNEDIVTGENENSNSYNEANNDMDTSRAMHTKNNIISMEMTEVHGGIQMSEKHLSLQSTNLNTINSIKNSKKKESKRKSLEQDKYIIQMQRTENINSPVDKSTTQNNIAHFDLSNTNVTNDQNTVIPMQASSIEQAVVVIKTRPHIDERGNKTKNHEKRHTLSLSDSNNTIRSSLNVNTSLDAVTEADKEENVQKTSDYRFNNSNQDLKAAKTNNEESIALDDQYESSNITEASMKMNISVNSMRETWQRRSNHFQSLISDKNEDTTEKHPNMDNQYSLAAENEDANDVDFLENISLIQRLRNISTQNSIPYNNKLRISEMKEKVRMDNRSNDVKIQRSEHTSGDSYVEGTPYPISRSVLFKTQMRHKTQNLDNSITSCSNNLNSMGKENIDKTKSDALYSETVEINTVILEDTSSGNPSDIQDQLRVIKDTVDETRLETRLETNEKNKVTTDNMECISVRKGRRRLLPLHENSELCSISPIEEDKCIVEKSIKPTKKNKKLRKKRPKKKSMGLKNDTSSIKSNIAREQTWSDNDYDIPKNKKKKDKKIQKPRKVVSKKIVIKKFADENVLNILKGNKQDKKDESIENRDSFDDFAKHRTISTQWNKFKSQQITIATTGLSKGDKSLVKSIVKSLGMAKIELNVSRRTTHVVSTGVRTVNLLRGIIRGCWLVTLEWVLKSLENNAWLNPEEFEMKHFSKAVQENRKDRQLFGPSYIPELFATCGLIYVGHNTTVPCHTLKELIKTASGHITENIKLAKIIIGTNGLKETWVIDCITTGELQLTNLYERK